MHDFCNIYRSVRLHSVLHSRDVTFHWRPGKHILYQLDHWGVSLAVESTEKKPMPFCCVTIDHFL